MKYIFLLIIAILSISTLKADYFTPNSGRSWNLDSLVANSAGAITFTSGAYYVNDINFTISKSDTLKIYENAIVYFPGLAVMTVKGTLLINPPDSVLFTAASLASPYKYLYLDSSYASSIRKLIFENANSIRLSDCSPVLDSCIIRNNFYYATGLQSAALSLFRSDAKILNCKFYDNVRAAINGGANIPNSPKIINCLFYRNNTSNYNVPQINLGSGGTDTLIIRGNTILRASTNSGAIGFLPTGGVPNLLIENNIIKSNRYGIGLLAGGINGVINNNIVDSCNIQGNPALGGSGLNFAGGWTASTVIAKNNIVRWNLWGVTIQNTAKPNLGNVLNLDTSDNGKNTFYGNGNNGHIYDLYNNTPDPIFAQNNFWGTTNLDSIENHIFHQLDTNILGLVEYIPIGIITNIYSNPISTPDNDEYLEVFPTPSNPNTHIKFKVYQSGLVTLKIYDLLGRELSTLFNSNLNKGIYESNWNASAYSSGVYIIRLVTTTNNYSKKIAIVK